jgi:hypothetical protein
MTVGDVRLKDEVIEVWGVAFFPEVIISRYGRYQVRVHWN